ncbi:MAG: hypothetical protein FJ357_03060 [Thaumarchaeota archaeon]|nr:hypothetical protein [Nitrososphaerota archaeon]
MDRIKRLSMQVLDQHKDKFSVDFADNKKILDQLAVVRSKGLKNEMAGYITKLLKREKDYLSSKEAPVEEEELEEVEETQVEAAEEETIPESETQESEIPQEITIESGEES